MLARMLDNFAGPNFGNFGPLFRLQDEMNRLFEDFFEDLPAVRPYGAGYPAINVWEDGDAAWAECELPGMSMDDVEVFVTGNELTLSGHRKLDPVEGAQWHRQERAQGHFSRSISLPWEIDADKVEARLTDGV